ncbi:toll/interleukin-1 receptor domain-containing protein [Flavobacteriaceae bacterium S0862]|nr:toll/interleukin-1 receptor domain-containing protein [Flavobacteriaceae bacterium S0862]
MRTIGQQKKRLLRVTLIAFVLVFLILLLQSIVGQIYQDLAYAPWVWLVFVYFPLLFVLLKVKNINSKVDGLYVFLFIILFNVSGLIVLLIQPLLSDIIAPSKILLRSFAFLIPLELIIIFSIWKRMIKTYKNENEESLDPIVFISYNHNDSEIALNIRDSIEAEGIDVIIDQEDMLAGENISSFINESINNSTITISIISNRSLKSAWVAMETVNSFYHKIFSKNKKFIGCFLDDDFFNKNFTLNAINDIDDQIKQNQELIAQYHDKMIDTRDLNNQNSRLLALRNNLDGIIGRLRDSLCLDIRTSKFDESITKILKVIRNND